MQNHFVKVLKGGKKNKTTIRIVYEGIVKECTVMALWRENMQIPKSVRERKEREKRKNLYRTGSFYVPGTGKL